MSAGLVLKMSLPGPPVAWARVRTRAGRFFNTEKTDNEKTRWRFYAGREWDGKPLLEGPLLIRCRFIFPIPKSWPKWKRRDAAIGKLMHTSAPDYDNLAKLVADALNGIVYKDDRQIVRAEIEKAYGPDPKTTIELVDLQTERLAA